MAINNIRHFFLSKTSFIHPKRFVLTCDFKSLYSKVKINLKKMAAKIFVLAIYVCILFLIGIIASRRVKSMSDYYLGGKKMGFWAVAFSARATGESGWLLIGLTGIKKHSGLPFFL